jgi:hypothetical protein
VRQVMGKEEKTMYRGFDADCSMWSSSTKEENNSKDEVQRSFLSSLEIVSRNFFVADPSYLRDTVTTVPSSHARRHIHTFKHTTTHLHIASKPIQIPFASQNEHTLVTHPAAIPIPIPIQHDTIR